MLRIFLYTFLSLSITCSAYTPTPENSSITPLFNYLDSCVWSSMDKGEYDEAESQAFQILNYAAFVKSENILANAYNTYGTVLSYNGRYPDALKNLFIGLRLLEKTGDELKTANAYSNIGSVYYEQKEYKKALEMFEKSIAYLEKLQHEPGIAATANNIGLVYTDLKQYEKAISYIKRSFDFDSATSNSEGLALSYLNFGRIYYELKEYKKAKDHYSNGLKLTSEISDTYTISKLLLNAARVDIIFSNYKEAQFKINQALQISNSDDNYAEQRDVYLTQHELDSAVTNLNSAYHSFRKFIHYRDMVSNDENSRRSAEAKIQYEYDKKQAIYKAEQEKKDAIEEQEQQKQALIRNSLAAGFVLLLALAAAIYRSYSLKKKAHEEISNQKEQIELQKELVEEKNREIVDSINYAKRLQSAILPPVSLIKSLLPESFIFYRPKDIVAGDFYFLEKIDTKLIIAVADCTGHGVPGALVSVICSTALSRAVKEFRLTDPARILDKVTELVLETFEKSENVVSDGMDVSLLVVDSELTAKTALWAGANNNIYIRKQRSEEMFELRGDKQPVGRFENRKPFTTHHLELEKGDKVFMFSDGYADQFGGEKGKKFKYSQLKDMLLNTSTLEAEHQLRKVEEVFTSWKGNFEQTDDVTLIGFKINN